MSARNNAPHNISLFAAILVFLLISILVKWQLEPVPSIEANAPGRFSAEQATKVLASVLKDEKPHPVDSEAADGVRERILDALKQSGYQADVQESTSCRRARAYVCARVKNIVALRKGSPLGKLILLSAHYDSVGAGPGASDDGSGVAVLLEVARLLQQAPNSKNSILFLFTEGEEAGLLGANAFAAQSPLAKDVALAINVEARGTSGQSALFETGSTSGWLIDAFAGTVRHPLADSLISTIYRLLPNDTDLTVFKSHGIQGLNFAYGEHPAYYHTPRDNLQSLDHGSLQQQGDNVYDLVRALLNSDIPAASAMRSMTYTDVLGMTIIRWPASISPIIAIVLLLVFAAASWRMHKMFRYSKGSVVRGFLLFPLSIALGGMIAYLLMLALSTASGHASAWHSDNLANRYLLWSSVLLAAILLQRLLARKSDPLGAWVGLGYAWLLAAIASALCLPGISYLFILPSLGLAVAALLVLIRPGMKWRSFALFLLPSLPALALLLQAAFLIEIMMGFNSPQGTIGMGIFVSLAVTFMAPFMPLNPSSKIGRYASLAILLIIAASAAISIRAAAYSSERPLAFNILYLQRPDGDAYLLSSNSYPPAAVMKAMGPQASMKEVFPEFKDSFLAEPITSAGLPSAHLTVLSEKPAARGRELVVRIDADDSMQRVELFFPKALGLHSIEMDGQVMNYEGSQPDYAGYSTYTCRGVSCNGRQLTLNVDSATAQPVWIEKFSSMIGPGSNLVAARNSVAIPRQDGDESIVMNKTSL